MSKVYYSRPGVILYQGDCLSVLSRLAPDCVDAVVTDPPYGQTNEAYETKDSISYNIEVWKECYRISRPDSCLVCFAGSPTYHRIATAIEAGGWRVRQMWAWIYKDGMITSAFPKEGFDRLAPAMTPIIFATKGKVLLNLQREGKPWESWQLRKGSSISTRATGTDRQKASGHWPKSVACSHGIEGLQYFVLSNTATGKRGEKTGHPNQKPLCLMEWIVGKLPGNSVLDPFAGSSTTGVACRRYHKFFTGIEVNQTYLDLSVTRFKEHLIL
jgi:site-specific DNA-methyltransferase (adenine-specific)